MSAGHGQRTMLIVTNPMEQTRAGVGRFKCWGLTARLWIQICAYSELLCVLLKLQWRLS